LYEKMIVLKKVKNMEKANIKYARVNVEGVHPVLWSQFKIICIERGLTMKQVVHEFLNAYVDQALRESKKKRNRVV